MSLRNLTRALSCAGAALFGLFAAAPTPAPTAKPTPGPAFAKMQWRAVGPAASGGRIAAVAGSATDANLYYAGTAGGGVWKTTNGGQSWQPVFEDQKVSAIGA